MTVVSSVSACRTAAKALGMHLLPNALHTNFLCKSTAGSDVGVQLWPQLARQPAFSVSQAAWISLVEDNAARADSA